MKSVIDEIAELKILPVVSLNAVQDAEALAKALKDGGIPGVEVTFRTNCAAQAIRAILEKYPEMLVGAGTVLRLEQVDAAIAAGAKFIVSPGINPVIVRYCMKKKIPIFPGCATASEVQQAIELGIIVLKFFPAEQCGGVETLKAFSAPFEQVRWIPTGGINLCNLKNYLDFPKVLACGGSFLTSQKDIQSKNWAGISSLCAKTVQLIYEMSHNGGDPAL